MDTRTDETAWKTVLVGCRWWGERLATAIVDCPLATLTAVVDRVPERAESLADTHDIEAFTAVEDALDHTAVDVAVLAVPPEEHAAVTTYCLDSGVHVYLEKPAGAIDDPDEILRLGELANERDLSLMPGYSQRYHPYARTAIDEVRAGTIGEVYSIDILRQTDWKPDPASAPGWGIHDYDLCCVLADSPPASIHPFSPRTDGQSDPATTEVLIEHENGVLSRARTHTRAEELEIVLRVHGDAGELVGRRVEQCVRVQTPDRTWELEYATAPSFESAAIAAFFESLESESPPPVRPEEVVHGRRVEATVYEALGISV